MLSEQSYKKILNYFDKHLWDGKTTDTNWNYYGLILDWYFDNSVLCIDYLDIVDFFDYNGGFGFEDDQYLSEQYGNIPSGKHLQVLENILNILKHSTVNKEQSNHMIEMVTKVLKREYVKINNPDTGYLTIKPDDILDSGSYCNIVRVREGVLRKELISIFQNDEKLKKRMRYEFENMQKLQGCPAILNVYDFDLETHSYLMEQCEKNLYKYLEDEMELSFEEKIKIIIDILTGMAFAHKNSIIHRDLHLGNILKIGNDFVIADFGLSKDLSIERSMKSSYTEKNNHLFVDPLAMSDFTKLDQKSDVYSVGKIIDYVFTHNTSDPNHIFKTIVERCISRNRDLRYETAHHVLNEVESILKNQDQVENIQNTINKILNNHYDAQVHDFIIDLTETDRISKFIVEHRLSTFWRLVLRFESGYQAKILQSISYNYSEATGYGGWPNYDIFAQISYNLCLNSGDLDVRKIARRILEGCAGIRYSAQNLLEQLPS
ncbi:serine/threonine protein kinase [Pontibacillus halophilus JSM 076056 = DSM 19796]|uniref:Serine/threonine protein kinase n=1 Tax=Pontibacillus halophilus JSM 076056 = DSM 19796 TaxID=1385510 RepID=A0A0A5HTZ0_9BACI|nr:protein kinase [Pontibacillus halophilus]KGX87092.1 serine/threonine protein kinase [Pontibacillus halophilus JSM 076056 = DSM 19796]